MENNNIQANSNISKLQSPFEQLRELDADGKEWWNSRKLARVMGYTSVTIYSRLMKVVKSICPMQLEKF